MTQEAGSQTISKPIDSLRTPVSIVSAGVPFPGLTLEIGLYAVLATVALLIRLLFIDYAPLSSDEAQQAISAWYFVTRQPFTQAASPLLFAGDSILFFLTGAHDLTPRLLPALFGTGLVLLPSLVRRELGQVGALIASILLTFSPTLVFFSRDGNGAIIAVASGLTSLAFAWRFVRDHASRSLYYSVALAALAFLSAKEVWTIVLVTVFFVPFALRRSWRAEKAGIVDSALGDAELTRARIMRAGLLFLAIFVGVSTVLLFHRGGAGAAFDLLGAWLASLPLGGSLFDPLRILVIYEPLLLFFGFAAVIHLFFDVPRQGPSGLVLPFTTGLAMVAFVIFSLATDKNPARLVVLVVPLCLLVGWYIGGWISEFRFELGHETEPGALLASQYGPVFLFSLALATFLYLIFAQLATRGSLEAAEAFAAITRIPMSTGVSGAVMTALISGAILVVAILGIVTLGWARAKHVFIAVALTIFLLWTIRQTALVSFSGDWNPREWLVARATSPSVRDLVFDLEDLSRWRANDSRTMTILADESLGPIARWYLRDFVNARFESHPVMTPGIEALLVPPTAPVNQGNLMSQHYRLESARDSSSDPNFFQWLLFRRSGPLVNTDAVLWIPQPTP